MADLCTDNRFELIEKYKQMLIEDTNIESAPDEMKVLDDILFRFWQMGWLDELERTRRCSTCKHWDKEIYESPCDVCQKGGSKWEAEGDAERRR